MKIYFELYGKEPYILLNILKNITFYTGFLLINPYLRYIINVNITFCVCFVLLIDCEICIGVEYVKEKVVWNNYHAGWFNVSFCVCKLP